MAAPHVCILQTSFAKREDTVAFLKEKVPGVRVEFITDSTLLTDVRANGGPSQAVIDRMTLYAKAAEISGADLIVNSCSTVGEVADIYAKEVNVPVMKIDLPMAQEAVRLGTKIALIATLETTLGPSQRLIEKVGAEQGKKMECTQYLQNPAWDALQAGHPEEHNRILMESIRELDKMGYDAIVMAQVSMRALLPDLKDVTITLRILRHLGCTAERDGDTVRIDSRGMNRDFIPHDLMRELRSSVIFDSIIVLNIQYLIDIF